MNTWSKADLHIHTTYSDGTAGVSAVLQQAAVAGLELVAITDHDTIAGALVARQLAPQYGIEVIVGEEISTADGHLLALFVETVIPPGLPAAETIAAVAAQGGLCIAPHPYDPAVSSLGAAGLRWRGYESSVAKAGRDWPLDAIEGFNAGLPWAADRANRLARKVAGELGLPIIGGSDSHILTTIGHGYTLFPGRGGADLYRAIRQKTVEWGGVPWSLSQHVEFIRLTIRRQSLRGALRQALYNMTALRGGRKPAPSVAAMAGHVKSV